MYLSARARAWRAPDGGKGGGGARAIVPRMRCAVLVMVTIARPPVLRDPEGGLDLPSVAMLAVALPLGVGAIQQLGSWGIADPRTIVGLLAGLCVVLLASENDAALNAGRG